MAFMSFVICKGTSLYHAGLHLQEEGCIDPKEIPIPMILHCPMCKMRHIDKNEFATKPHHTHACQCCGFVWRPAIQSTVGVQFLPGFKDE